ncbi:EamA family transporter [Candidatus Woesearchaeota archaeon]|nr:EamA family transporter [Candidatus Woesearchaeota archaeon]
MAKKFYMGLIYAFLAVLLLSTIGTSFKFLVSNLDSFSVAIYTQLFATIALFVYLLITDKTKRVITEFLKHPWFFVIAGIIGLGIQQITYIKAFSLLPAAEVVIIFYMYPLLMVLLSSIIFRERTNPRAYIFILLGLIGVYTLISKGQNVSISLNFGIIMVILASLSWALFSVMIKHTTFDVEIGMFLFNLFGLVFLSLAIPFFGITNSMSQITFFGLIYMAVFPTALAFVFWNKCLHILSTSLCSSIALLIPLLSVLLISLILKEQLGISHVIGLFLITSSVLLSIIFRNN